MKTNCLELLPYFKVTHDVKFSSLEYINLQLFASNFSGKLFRLSHYVVTNEKEWLLHEDVFTLDDCKRNNYSSLDF